MGAGKGRARRAAAAVGWQLSGDGLPFVDDSPGGRPVAGDGWIECEQGHEHWGLYGAAGLMLRHVDSSGQVRYLLTHRAGWVDHGDTYSIPGGAINLDEAAKEGAERETAEELGLLPDLVYTHASVADHGGWAYHTVHCDVPDMFEPETLSETNSVGWFTPEEIDQLPLHPGDRKSRVQG